MPLFVTDSSGSVTKFSLSLGNPTSKLDDKFKELEDMFLNKIHLFGAKTSALDFLTVNFISLIKV